MSIVLVVMSGGEETSSQRRGGAGGNQTDHGKETAVETDTENEMRLPPSKLRGSSMMSGAGKTVSGVKKTRNRILKAQVTPLLIKRNPTLDCQGP